MSPLRRVLIGGIAIASTLLLVAIGGFLSAPLWIDVATIKKEIAAQVLRATGHVVAVDRLQLHLFPPVRVEVAQPRYTIPGVAELTAQALIVDLDLPALVSGRVQPRNLHLSGVTATIRLPAAAAGAEPVSAASFERTLRDVLTQLTQATPGLRASRVDDLTV